jgi:hypothetical protein
MKGSQSKRVARLKRSYGVSQAAGSDQELPVVEVHDDDAAETDMRSSGSASFT